MIIYEDCRFFAPRVFPVDPSFCNIAYNGILDYLRVHEIIIIIIIITVTRHMGPQQSIKRYDTVGELSGGECPGELSRGKCPDPD